MALFKVPKDVSVDDFFKSHVPKQFAEMTKSADMSAMAGKEFTVQFDVSGKKYGLRIKDGKSLNVIAGGMDKPMLGLKLNEPDWRDTVTGKTEGIIDRFTDPSQAADPAMFSNLLSTRGTLHVELRKPDGSVMPFSMTFNGEAQPAATIKLSLSDWVSMQKKETNGQNLFMAGKMQFEGDVVFLMSLNNLL